MQGVGFRPHVWQLAHRHCVSGFVLNDGDGVVIEAQGTGLDSFIAALTHDLPPLARVDELQLEPAAAISGETGFAIRDSRTTARANTAIAADVAVCPECLAEILDPSSRRYLYAFTTCTHCGPRFTLIRRLPYDRSTTTLAPFALCEPCAREYHDPADRRFHAETTCCPACGPSLGMPVPEIARRVLDGGIVALKGLGGFQLVCDARNAAAVAGLRARKRRDGKPFAVMVCNLESARRLAVVSDEEALLLAGRERPIVLLHARDDNGLAGGIHDGLGTIGLFLPATPLHWLLLHALLGRPDGTAWLEAGNDLALIATSANVSGEPIAIDDREAAVRLAGVADAIAGHDRAILARADDSVMHMMAGAPALVRRARGFTPLPIRLPHAVPSIAALGADLKATVTLTRGAEAFVSQHVGDLDTVESECFLEEVYRHLVDLLGIVPERVALDAHPDAVARRLAARLELQVVEVQHHHAHAAALAAEHGHAGPLLGLCLDGFGYGSDGGAWGGELLVVHGPRFEHWGALRPLPLPGGDRASREPWRMAAAALHVLGRGNEISRRFADEPLAPVLAQLLAAPMPLATTTSAGRLFDAAAGLLGVCRRQAYEGEAAMRLEFLADTAIVDSRGWTLSGRQLDMTPLLARLADGMDAGAGAALLHGTLAEGLADWVHAAASDTGLGTVALGGGCFLNRRLSAELARRLAARGLDALIARQVPPNDGGLSLGQAWIAGLGMLTETSHAAGHDAAAT